MNVLVIISIVLILALIIFGIEFMMKLNKSEGKLIDEVKKSLIIRINIITVLIIILSVISIINIVIRN